MGRWMMARCGGDLCREKRVRIAYSNSNGTFVVDDETGEFGSYKDYKTGRVVRIYRFIDVGVEYSHIPHNWDILETFLKTNAIIPVWVNCACRSWLGEVRGKLVNNTFDIIIVVD